MKLSDKEKFLESSKESLANLYDMIHKLKPLKIEGVDEKETAFVIVDMINGFVRKGALSSERIEGIIPEVIRLSDLCKDRGIKQVAFCDAHSEASPEFHSYPVHCIRGTEESELIDEIKCRKGITIIRKNSTNGFIEEDFKNWLDGNKSIKHFIVVGDCTDICVMQLALSLKTYFNMKNDYSEVIVPVNAVETFDLGVHNADMMNVLSLFVMESNGVKLVSHVE